MGTQLLLLGEGGRGERWSYRGVFYPAPPQTGNFLTQTQVNNLSDEKRLHNRRFGFFFLSKNTSVMDQVRAWKQPFGFELLGGFQGSGLFSFHCGSASRDSLRPAGAVLIIFHCNS